MAWIRGTLTIASLVKAVVRVAVAGKDDDLVAALLQADGGVDDQSLGPANAQVGMEEDYGLFLECVILLIVAVVGRHGEQVMSCLFFTRQSQSHSSNLLT